MLQCNTKCSGNVVLSYDSGCSDVAQEGSDFSGNCWCCVWTLPVIYGKVGRRAERVKTGLSFPKTTWGWSSGAVHGWEKARGACNFPIKLLTSSCIISVAKISNNCIYISHWLLASLDFWSLFWRLLLCPCSIQHSKCAQYGWEIWILNITVSIKLCYTDFI